MTKEELEKEAGEWLKDNIRVEIRDGLTFNIVPTPVQIYCAGAEPREKQIAELEAEVTRLKNENLDIINKYTRFAETDRRTIADLQAQIEKMKCCSNCKHFNKEDDLEYCWNCERQLVNSLDNLSREEIIKDEWEIKEK